jgi:hypothetical protein
MSTVVISRTAKLRIQVKKYARNTLTPSATLQNAMAMLAGYGALVRAKPVFSECCDLSAIPASTVSDRPRWRFRAHAGPYVKYLFVQFTMARQDNLTAADCYVRARVRDAGGTIIGDAIRHYGTSSSAPDDVPSEWGTGQSFILTSNTDNTIVELPADADYTVEFADVSYGRLVAAQAWEVSAPPTTELGYALTTNAMGGPIYDEDRSDLVTMGRTLHKHHSAQLWNWHTDTDAGARVTTSASYKNPIDDTSTTPSSATPGAKLNLLYHTTLSRVADGCRLAFWVYASSSNSTGSVRLVDDAGATMIDCPITSTTAAWHGSFGYVPAVDSEKYDLHYGGTTGTLTLYATSLFEFDGLGDTATVTADEPADVRIRAFDATASM